MALMDNVDLMDLAIKGKLIGATFYLADDTQKVISGFELNMAIDQICIKFSDGEQNFFNFRDKFKVATVDAMVRVKKGKVKMHKKKK